MTAQIGLPANMLQDNYVNQFYSQLPIQKLDFFLNVNHAISFLTEYSQTKLKTKKEEFGYVIIILSSVSCLVHGCYVMHRLYCRWLDDLVSNNPKVLYNVASNKVIIPLSLLAPPYFETGYPE